MSLTNYGGFISANGTPQVTPTVEYQVVASGGGAGGPNGNTCFAGAGGGAGGFLTATNFAVTPGTAITVTVGAGGAVNTSVGTSGGNSVFSSITAAGGGGGAWGQYNYNTVVAQNGAAGGSGGGGQAGGSGGAASPSGQGNAGSTGSSASTSPYPAGGGGGAGSAAINANLTTGYGGAGGTGIVSSISGQQVKYACGGGGGSDRSSFQTQNPQFSGNASHPTAMGLILGGNPSVIPVPGLGNGGAGSGYVNGFSGSAGGDGSVIIRYPASYAAAKAVTGSPIVEIMGGYRIYIWQASSGSITF